MHTCSGLPSVLDGAEDDGNDTRLVLRDPRNNRGQVFATVPPVLDLVPAGARRYAGRRGSNDSQLAAQPGHRALMPLGRIHSCRTGSPFWVQLLLNYA